MSTNSLKLNTNTINMNITTTTMITLIIIILQGIAYRERLMTQSILLQHCYTMSLLTLMIFSQAPVG